MTRFRLALMWRNVEHATAMAIMCVIVFSCSAKETAEDADSADPPPVIGTNRPATFNAVVEFLPALTARREATVRVRLTSPTGDLVLEPDSGSELHLIVVKRDLSFYSHLHPRMTTDDQSNSFVAPIKPPESGAYVMFVIFKPIHHAEVVLDRPFSVRGSAPQFEPAVASPRSAHVAGFDVGLNVPEKPIAGRWTTLVFSISRNGTPVKTLRHTGTLGHVVAIKQEAASLLLGHTTEGEALGGGVRAGRHIAAAPEGFDLNAAHPDDAGPDVEVHFHFTQPGTYKVWGEFTVEGKAIVAPFTVDVAE